MKKVLLFLISTMLFLCSCTPNEKAYDPHNKGSYTYKINSQDTINMAEDIITYLDNKDKDGEYVVAQRNQWGDM